MTKEEKASRWQNIHPVNIDQKRVLVAMLLPDKTVFKARSMTTKKGHFIKVKYSPVLLSDRDTF